MSLHLTRDERDRIAADGRGVLFRAGSSCGRPEFGQDTCRCRPPAEFVEAAQACEHCEGSARPGMIPESAGGWYRCSAGCIDGKRRIAAVACEQGLIGHVVVTWGPLMVVGFGVDDGLGYDADYVRLFDGTKVTPPPDIDPQSLVGQYAIGVEVAP